MSSNKNSKKGNRGFKKLITGAIAVAIAVVLCVTMIPQDALAATADLDTSTKYSESLGDEYSTEYAGRIWTDKSVGTESLTYNNKSVSLGTGEDFLVTFSALSTSQSITGSASAPVDVVFVIDMSQSMGTSMGSGSGNRLYNAVNALNTSVTDILALNPNNRIGVIAFNSTSYELLPLDSYTANGSNAFFSCRSNGSTVTINAVNSAGTVISKTHSSTNGTNIQKGLSAGLNMLATEDNITVTIDGKTVTRIPAVVLLSDGQPTSASDYTIWWNINGDTAKKGPVSTSAIYGMKALMTGAYMKEAVNVRYNLTNASAKTQVYTIGVGISSLGTNEKNLANVTLNPEDYLGVNNTMSNSIEDAWNNYRTGKTAALSGYTFNHPSSNLVNNVVDIGRATASDTTIAYEDLYYADEYYDATSASDVADVFAQIVQNISISTPEVPTEIKGSNPITDGYITYTDPIGEYMEVKAMKALVYNDTTFEWVDTRDTKTTSGNVTTYTFKPTETVDTGVYEDQSVSNIIIQVTQTDATHQTMVIKVPAALVPVHVNTVTLNADGNVVTHTHNEMGPVRVIYSVGLQDSIYSVTEDGTRIINTEKLAEAYIEKNLNSNGEIDFYSNLYSGNTELVVHANGDRHEHTIGDATVTFEPAHTNPFYYMQEDVLLYEDEAFTKPVKVKADGTIDLDDKTTYYYKEVYYHADEIVTKAVGRTGFQLERTSLIAKADADGNTYVYRAAGSPRLNKIMLFEGTKAENRTKTADEFYLPTFQYKAGSTSAYDGYYQVYLGNNGVISVAATGNLAIRKAVVLGDGLTGPGTDYEYEFTVNFNGNNTLSGSYYYTVVDVNGNTVSTQARTIADGGTIKLKADETAIITGLPHGTTYSVTETAVAGMKANFAYSEETAKETDTVKKTIEAGNTDTVVTTNTYSVEKLTVDVDNSINAVKVLKGKSWSSTDTFKFYLKSRTYDTPMPSGAEAVANSYWQLAVDVTAAAGTVSGTEVGFDFGSITYTKPGTYVYEISEDTTMAIDGVTYSGAMYEVVVTVTDKGNGTLTAAVSMTQNLNDAGEDEDKASTKAVFTNVYDPDEESWIPYGTKTYVDTTGTKPITNGMFGFVIEKVTADAPMPEKAGTATTYTVRNLDHDIAYEAITFDKDDIGKTYVYKFYEDTSTEIAGMEYDPTAYWAEVKVSQDKNGPIVLDVKYYKDADRTQEITTGIVFTNTYEPVSVLQDIKVTKVLDGRAWADGDVFTFTLSGDNALAKALLSGIREEGKQVSVSGTAGSAESATETFASLVFDRVGTYVFNIKETKGTLGGVTYDTHVSKVIVDVTDPGTGKLAATVNYSDNNANTSALFTNTYEAEPVTVNLYADKTLSGRTIKEGEFFVDIEAVSPNAAKYTAIPFPASDKVVDGKYYSETPVFTELQFTEAGSYVYYITESVPTGAVDNKFAGVTYDTTKYKYTVDVTDNGNGQLVADATLIKVDASGNQVGDAVALKDGKLYASFANVYTTEPAVHIMPTLTKDLTGPKALVADAYEFTLEGADDVTKEAIKAGTVVLPATTAKNASDGTITFGEGKIAFKEVGTYKIKISEVIPSGATADNNYTVDGITYSTNVIEATIVVTDDTHGNLVAKVNSRTGDLVFTNVYATSGSTEIPVTKSITGNPWTWGTNDKFEFEIISHDPATIAAISAGDIVIAEKTIDITKAEETSGDKFAITINAPGTFYFTVHEVTGDIAGMHYDGVARTVKVVATDDGNGNLDVTYSVSGNADLADTTKAAFVNTYDVTHVELSGHYNLRVIKNFVGRDWAETDTFTFQLAAADVVTSKAITDKHVVLPATTLTVSTENNAYSHFGNIMFDADGTYTFVVTEDVPANAKDLDGDGKVELDGTEYDNAKYYVQVNVDTIETTVDNKKVDVLEISSVKYADTYEGLATAKSYHNGASPAQAHQMTFTNIYNVTDVAENIFITKELVNRGWTENDVFTFVIEADGADTEAAIKAGTVVINESSITTADTDVTVDAEGIRTLTFDDIRFKAPGTYGFKIYEVIPTGDGFDTNITYDSHVLYVQVIVVDNYDGTLSTEMAVVSEANSKAFVNTYAPDPADVTLNGMKVLKGRDLLGSDEFEFVITAVDNAPLPAEKTVSNSATGEISFGTIRFTEAGTYKYHIQEVHNADPGITCDNSTITATVVVKDVNGELKANISYTGMNGTTDVSTDGFTFTNVYKVEKSDAITFSALKKVNPATGHTYRLEAGTFEFKLLPASNNPSSDPISNEIVVSNDVYGNVDFIPEGVSYTEPGVYKYTIGEIRGEVPGIEYDNSIYEVTVTVTDNPLTAKLKTEVVITLNNEPVDSIHFNNGYDPAHETIFFYGDKILTGDKALEAGDFTFKLTPVSGEEAGVAIAVSEIPMPAEDTTTNMVTGHFHFGTITYDRDGVYVYEISEVNDKKAGYKYDDTKFGIKVTVSHSQTTGEYVAKVEHLDGVEKVVFKNTYAPIETSLVISGTKELTGRDLNDKEFTFTLYDSEGKKVETVANKADGTFTFTGVDFKEAGKYKYSIVEDNTNLVGVTYDLNTYAVNVVVEDVDGYLTVTDTEYITKDKVVDDIVFKNTYEAVNATSINLGAVKTLTGRELKAGEFTFLLTGTDGTKLTATNTADGSIFFDEITFNKAGTYEYVITEAKGNDADVDYDESKYTVTVVVKDDLNGNYVAEITSITKAIDDKEVSVDAVTFVNAYEVPEPGTSPKTSDIFNIWLLLAVIVVAGAGLMGATVYSRRG